ncbi:hypothetical protein AB0M57_04270 [Streptomyces sp. NPDC051597]|uniref:hypothetical protein n=1 Tax=Streptomyces sp. NPDC051597 TaxID=3155049 RepID=UPI00341361B3
MATRKVAPPPNGYVWIEDYRSEDGAVFIPGIATRLGISPAGYKKWRMRDEGPTSFRIGKKVAASIEAIEAWLSRREGEAADRNRASLEAHVYDSRPAEPSLPRQRPAA